MPELPLLTLNIDPDSIQPLAEQLYQNLRQRIVSGVFQSGDKLPSTRRLADELGVSRTTIISAYDQLIAEGFVWSKTGSGIYVSEIGEIESLPSNQAIPPLPDASTASTLRQIRPLHPGHPDPRLFPLRQWSKCVSRVARTEPAALIQSDDLFGDHLLREQISRYLFDWRALKADPSQIIVTAGAGDALELAINTLLNKDTTIYLENPGYVAIRQFVESRNLPFRGLELDQDGARIPALDSHNKQQNLAILTPSSQFPLGGAMPHKRRMEFINWARENNGWIIEDDYDSEFRYAGRPIPSLASLDRNQRTLYVGSFAKIFSTGLRLGFIVVTPALQADFIATLRTTGSKASNMAQRPLGLFMQSGDFYRHIRRVRRIYSERRQHLIQLIQNRLSELANIEDHKAGMHLFLPLPAHIRDIDICSQAEKKGLSCSALSQYYMSSESRNGLLLGYCSFTEQEMNDAMDKLVELIRVEEQQRD